MPIFVFDIETIPDVELGRRIYDLGDLSDRQVGYVMQANGYPVAAMVLGIVMGTMVEQSFITSLIKSDGSILPFFERPVSAVLASLTIGALIWPMLYWAWRRFSPKAPRPA